MKDTDTRDTIISAENLSLTFQTNDGPVHALKDVSLDVKQGDFVSFIGPSGCGKTTFLRVMADLEHQTAGTITVNGVTPEEAVQIAKAFGGAGADVIDVSAGQTSTDAKPVYGRMFQTPFSDRIRNETGLATMAVGNIYEVDHVNSILMAGRADLVCLARPHLADPYWTLHAATALGDEGTAWPLPYLAGRDQARRLAEKAAEEIRA